MGSGKRFWWEMIIGVLMNSMGAYRPRKKWKPKEFIRLFFIERFITSLKQS